jgi:hypothetical protein
VTTIANNKDVDISFEIGFSQIYSNVLNHDNFFSSNNSNDNNKSILQANDKSNFIKNVN